MNLKTCTKCGISKYPCADNFHWDKVLCKGLGGFVSACKVCKNNRNPLPAKQRKKRLALLGIKEHIIQYQKHREKRLIYAKKLDVIETRKKRVRLRYGENPKKFLDIKKAWVAKNKDCHSIVVSNRIKKEVKALTDCYVAGCASRFFKIPRSCIYETPYMIEMYRLFIKMKRACNFNNTKYS